MVIFPARESLGAFLGFALMDGNTFGIRGDEIDRRIQEYSGMLMPFSILVPGDPLADFCVHPTLVLGGISYVFEYAGMEPGPKIFVQIRRTDIPFSASIMRRFATKLVNIPDLYRMRDGSTGKIPPDPPFHRSPASPLGTLPTGIFSSRIDAPL
jgi:hypothetical protein